MSFYLTTASANGLALELVHRNWYLWVAIEVLYYLNKNLFFDWIKPAAEEQKMSIKIDQSS